MPATPRMDMVDAPTGVRHSRMYHPLVDIDVNTRLLGPKPSSLPSPSKTRSPTPSPSPHSESRRLPSGVNPSESPRYTAPSNSPTLAMLPAHRSKIPRKAHSSAAIATPERTQAQALGPKASFIAGASTIPKLKSSPPADRDKPLPSPPIVQVMNSASPPKANRTLIDAEVAGTPSSEEWPAITPEKVSSGSIRESTPTHQMSDPPTANYHSTSGAAQKSESTYNSTGTLVFPCELDSVFTDTPMRDTGAATPQSTSLVDLSSSGVPSATIHAVTTTHCQALESPLARKLAIPPRTSSKRLSLPLPDDLYEQPMVTAALAATSRRREAKPGSTMWPLLDTDGSEQDNTDTVSDHLEGSTMNDQNHNGMQEHNPDILGSAHIHEKHNSLDSTSTWSMAAGSSLDSDSHEHMETCTRVKRLTGHPIKSGFGPILKIEADADAVILGNGEEVPPIPSGFLNRSQQKLASSLEAQTSQVKKAFTSTTMGLASKATRVVGTDVNSITTSPTPKSRLLQETVVCKENNRSSPVIRSSESSRKASETTSLVPDAMQQVSAFSRSTRPQGTKPAVRKHSPRVYQYPSHGLSKNKTVDKTPTPSPASTKTHQVHSMTPSPSKPATSERSKTSPLLMSAKQHDGSRTSGSKRPSPLATSVHYGTIESSGVNPSAASRSKNLKTSPDHPVSERLYAARKVEDKARSPTVLNNAPPSASVSQGYKETGGKEIKNAKEITAKVKSKRSLRDIFHRKDNKEKVPPLLTESKRSSLTVAGSSLAKRIRHSTNFSKTNTQKDSQADNEHHPEPNADDAILSSTDIDKQSSTTHIPTLNMVSEAYSNAVSAVDSIVTGISALPESSPDRLRALEIAEVCEVLRHHVSVLKQLLLTMNKKQAVLNCLEAAKRARIAAAEAQKYAREAELHAQRANIELGRLQQLCESNFNSETVQAIKAAIRDNISDVAGQSC